MRQHKRIVAVKFKSRADEYRAITSFLKHDIAGFVSRGGVHVVPDSALDLLWNEDIPFAFLGKATRELIKELGIGGSLLTRFMKLRKLEREAMGI